MKELIIHDNEAGQRLDNHPEATPHRAAILLAEPEAKTAATDLNKRC